MTITTNNHWRDFCYRDDVPATVLESQFDWTNDAHEESGDYSDGFLQYRGHWYHLGDFVRCRHDGWHGCFADSFFSGVMIRLSDDGQQYQIGTWVGVVSSDT